MKKYSSPLEKAVSLIGDKWKLLIISNLLDGKKRFGQLRDETADVSQKVLTAKLRELEEDGIVSRRVFAEMPPRVEYSLTVTGKKIKGVITEMSKFGDAVTNEEEINHGAIIIDPDKIRS